MRKRKENVYKKAPAATGAYDTYVVCTKDTYMLARDVSSFKRGDEKNICFKE